MLIIKLKAGDEGEMVAEAFLLEFHALVGAAGHKAAIELILFQQELGGMNEHCIHLIIYIRRH